MFSQPVKTRVYRTGSRSRGSDPFTVTGGGEEARGLANGYDVKTVKRPRKGRRTPRRGYVESIKQHRTQAFNSILSTTVPRMTRDIRSVSGVVEFNKSSTVVLRCRLSATASFWTRRIQRGGWKKFPEISDTKK